MPQWLIIFSIVIAWIATIIEVATITPQAIKVFKTKDTQSLSFFMYTLYVVGSVVWLLWVFGFMSKLLKSGESDFTNLEIILQNIPAIFLNVIAFLFGLYILINKTYNVRHAKKLGITEREFSQKRVIKKEEK